MLGAVTAPRGAPSAAPRGLKAAQLGPYRNPLETAGFLLGQRTQAARRLGVARSLHRGRRARKVCRRDGPFDPGDAPSAAVPFDRPGRERDHECELINRVFRLSRCRSTSSSARRVASREARSSSWPSKRAHTLSRGSPPTDGRDVDADTGTTPFSWIFSSFRLTCARPPAQGERRARACYEIFARFKLAANRPDEGGGARSPRRSSVG